MRRLALVPLVVSGALLLPGAGAGQSAGKTWASGLIIKLGGASITVRGSVSLMLPGSNGQLTRSDMSGTRALKCELKGIAATAAVRGYHVGSRARITCLNGTLKSIAH